ncbi:alpha/beta fold hydrolase [Bordetella genomosp. 4]|uniref:Alpha/beta hydrolase n=1 Tax=Bordetella genomosp. 4 TaxID=463044 RepID=A0A261UW97_9BORD|nr:alpha/beta hydrolase [Bordetella genomosp. 4]OZI66156.1 alpha/beta hydrolase [Bordetella genomosp. 4]
MQTVSTHDTFIPTPGGRLFARNWTPGKSSDGHTPIVLQHDSLGCVELWRDFPEQLAIATGRPVIAYDRLGFGRSDPRPGMVGVNLVDEEAHGDFRTVLDTLGVERFITFGHSIGGGMSIACAAMYPDTCVALITESAQVFAEAHTLEGIRQAKIAFAEPGQLDRLKKYHGDKAAWVLAAWTETWLSPAFADWNLNKHLSKVRCPVLSLHGDNDEYGSLEHMHRIHALTGSTTAIMEGCGHLPHREKPQAVITIIRDWLQTADIPDQPRLIKR